LKTNLSGGTASALIIDACRRTGINPKELHPVVSDDHYRTLTEAGLNENQIKLSERFPINEVAFVRACLDQLQQRAVIEAVDYPSTNFDTAAAEIETHFKHDRHLTYIFPEEARLLYALAHITTPKRVAFLGSYYGYWAAWALAAMESKSDVALLDVDPSVGSLASENLMNLRRGNGARSITTDAIIFMNQADDESYDWIVLDAEGPKCGLPYDQTDKALYGVMLEAALPKLRPGGLLICHNILLSHHNDDPYFANMIRNNKRQFYKFDQLVRDNFSATVTFPTTEGVGVYRR